jgi:hypothetical protein
MKTKLFALVLLFLVNAAPALADDWDLVPATAPKQAVDAISARVPDSAEEPIHEAVSQIQSATGFDLSSLTSAIPMPDQVKTFVQPVLDNLTSSDQQQQQPSTGNQTPDGLPQCTTCTLAPNSGNGLPQTSLAIISNQ